MAITKAQRMIWDALAVFQREYGYTPSTRELGRFVGKSQATVQIQLTGLIERGGARRINDRVIELLPLE